MLADHFGGETALFQDVGEGALRERGVQGHDGSIHLVGGSFLERDVASLLAELDEADALERTHQAFTRNARQAGRLFCDFDDGPEGRLGFR